MGWSNRTGWFESVRRGMALPIVLTLAVAVASGAERITEPRQNSFRGPATRPMPQQQAMPARPRFGPARPALESPAAFTPDMSFGQAIDILRNSTRPPLNLVVLWRELEENAGVDRNTPIGIDGLHGLRLRQCLEVLLTSMSATSPAKIGYVVDHGLITIATVDSLPKAKPVTRIYDISDLVAPPSTGMGLGMGFGMMPGMMSGMMPGLGGGMLGGYGQGVGNYAPGYGNYGGTSGYNSLGGLPGLVGNFQGSGVYGR